jgi:Fe-S-cluster containining protein
MLQIQHTLVSLDLIEKYFVCDLDACLGACCIEGDAGAPLAPGEAEKIERILPEVENDLLPRALEEIRNEGASYTDPDGDLVTQIVDGRDCVYTCYAAGGKCLCALEKAFREGRIPDVKPISCRLYPVRLKEYDGFTAVNMHRWKICRPAETLGRRLGVRAYQFLKGPLIARFGKDWYSELELTAAEYLRQHPDK